MKIYEARKSAARNVQEHIENMNVVKGESHDHLGAGAEVRKEGSNASASGSGGGIDRQRAVHHGMTEEQAQKLKLQIEQIQPLIKSFQHNINRLGAMKEMCMQHDMEFIMHMDCIQLQMWRVSKMIIDPTSFAIAERQRIGEVADVAAAIMRKESRHMPAFFTINGQQLCQRSLYFLSYRSAIRQRCVQILKWPWFDWFILSCIVANTILMCTENYKEPCAPWNDTLKIIDTVLLVVYTFELFVKVVSRGFCVGEATYMRDPWNYLDISVVLSGWITVGAAGKFQIKI